MRVYQLIYMLSSSFQNYIEIKRKHPYNIAMEKKMKEHLAAQISNFHLPAYEELPDTGLYLQQTSQYINQLLEPLGCMEITGSMISNYVKKGLVSSPVKKQYYPAQIAHLICITMLKGVLSLEHIQAFFLMQKKVYTDEVAYNYFVEELENILFSQFGIQSEVEEIGVTSSREKKMLRSAIIAVCHSIYLSLCFQYLNREE